MKPQTIRYLGEGGVDVRREATKVDLKTVRVDVEWIKLAEVRDQ